MANHLDRLAFVDETSVKTNMAKTTGWAPFGQRLVDHAPFGHWRTQTFVAALRHDRLDAPWVIDGAMNREGFERYVDTQLAPTLRRGDVVILDTLSSHKSPRRRSAQGTGRLVPLPAAIFAGPEPHRDGLLETQSVDKEGCGQNLRRAMGRRRQGLRPLHRGGMHQLLPGRRIQNRLIATRSERQDHAARRVYGLQPAHASLPQPSSRAG